MADLAAEQAEEDCGASCTDAGHDVPVNKECRHEFVWVVWTRLGKKQDNAEEDATFAGRRTYTWNVDEMAPLARAGKRDERVGLEPKEANDAVHAVVDLTAEDAEEWPAWFWTS